MSQPEAMTIEEAMAFTAAVDKARERQAKTTLDVDTPQQREADHALLLASDHIQAFQRRNNNLALERLRLDAILGKVLKFRQSLQQAIGVAERGVLVGEVVALKSTLSDMETALGLNDEEDGKEEGDDRG